MNELLSEGEPKSIMEGTEMGGGLLGGFAHLPEIVNDAISGIIALILYWPFIWLFFSPKDIFENPQIMEVFIKSYTQFVGISSSWLAFPFILLALPCIGLLNRAIVYTFIDTLLLKCIFRNRIFCKISEGIHEFSIKLLKKQLDRSINDEYLFSWDEIPGNDNTRLIEFLKQNFSIHWVKTVKIEKIDDGKTIRLSSENNYLLLKLNTEKTKANLEIDDGRKNQFTVKMEEGKLNIYNDEKSLNIDKCCNPCWKLEGSFDFVGYRHWLIKNQTRKIYWDWEHFLDWVYKIYYQSFIFFIILYLALLIYKSYRFGIYAFGNNLPFLFAFILVLLTYALYREYLRHHIAWIWMDLRFYVEYIIEERDDVNKCTKKILKKYIIEENYEGIERTLIDEFYGVNKPLD